MGIPRKSMSYRAVRSRDVMNNTSSRDVKWIRSLHFTCSFASPAGRENSNENPFDVCFWKEMNRFRAESENDWEREWRRDGNLAHLAPFPSWFFSFSHPTSSFPLSDPSSGIERERSHLLIHLMSSSVNLCLHWNFNRDQSTMLLFSRSE